MKPSNWWRKISISKIEGSLLCSDGLMLGVKSEHIQNYTKVIMMTDKRFVIKNDGVNEYTVSDRLNQYPMPITDLKNCEFIADALNGLWDKVMQFNKYSQEYLERANKLEEENEQLKQRNDRQAKRLAKLYELMAKKDWESLTEIIDDFCSCEEQLQREWRTYE